ncbi:MAG: hypothetical protein LAO23_21800, partial [Acidobacteriia bacterium]|nr:hypothetical protein [Terriglobia bacterium]
MRIVYAAVALCALLTSPVFASPADTVLDANKAASGGKAWDNKATLKQELTLSGQGLAGTATYMADLTKGRFVGSFTLGPATGGNGYDGTHAWIRDPSGTITMQDSGESLKNAVNESYRDAN